MEPVKPRELATAARVADGLVYVAGVAGVVAGAMLFRGGDVAFALVAWVLTFVAGAALRLAAWAGRALAQLLERTERMEADLADLHRGAGPATPPVDEPGPWRRGWH